MNNYLTPEQKTRLYEVIGLMVGTFILGFVVGYKI